VDKRSWRHAAGTNRAKSMTKIRGDGVSGFLRRYFHHVELIRSLSGFGFGMIGITEIYSCYYLKLAITARSVKNMQRRIQ
jgi:hypothetical protein